jgi:hypothetical protein
MDTVLDGLRLGDGDEQQSGVPVEWVDDQRFGIAGFVGVVGFVDEAEDRGPEASLGVGVVTVDGDVSDACVHGFLHGWRLGCRGVGCARPYGTERTSTARDSGAERGDGSTWKRRRTSRIPGLGCHGSGGVSM